MEHHCDRFCSSRLSAVDANTVHVAEPVGAAGLQRHHGRLGTGHRHAAVTGGVAVAVAGWPRCAGFRQAPIGREAISDPACEQFGIGLRGRTDSLHRLIGNVDEDPPRVAGIDHRRAEEIGRRAGHGEQGSGNQATGRGFRDRDGLFPRNQSGGDLLGDRNEFLHRFSAPGPKHEILPCAAFDAFLAHSSRVCASCGRRAGLLQCGSQAGRRRWTGRCK